MHSTLLLQDYSVCMDSRYNLVLPLFIFNILRKIIEHLNAHIIYSPLVYSKISYGLIKITELSCTFSMILWIQNKKIFVFNYKKHMWKDIFRYKRLNFQPSKWIPRWDPTFAAYHNSVFPRFFKMFFSAFRQFIYVFLWNQTIHVHIFVILASFFLETFQFSLQHPHLPIFSSSSPLPYFLTAI